MPRKKLANPLSLASNMFVQKRNNEMEKNGEQDIPPPITSGGRLPTVRLIFKSSMVPWPSYRPDYLVSKLKSKEG